MKSTVIVVIVLAGCVLAALRKLKRDRQRKGCSGNCGQCPYGQACVQHPKAIGGEGVKTKKEAKWHHFQKRNEEERM